MPDLLDKTEATSVSQTDAAVYAVINRTTTPADRWMQPANFFKARTGNDSVLGYASLSAAVTAIGATQATLEIPAATTVSSSLTIPSNITLAFMGIGVISVASGQTLTINGPLQAPLRQVFTGTGSVKFGPHVGIGYPQWFGAVYDNSTDDAGAIQKCIDAFKSASATSHAGIVEITGGAVIASTLTILYSSIKLRGHGWGVQNSTPYHGFLRWNGSAGSPMILITESWGSGVEDIRLIGKSTAKPSAAIEFRDNAVGAHGQDFGYVSNVYIGHMYGYDTDFSANGFVAGILHSGAVNGDHNKADNISINGCDIGIDIQNSNATTQHFGVVTITDCNTAIRTKADIVLDVWQNGGPNGVDLEFDYPSVFVDIRLYQSEGSGRMAVFNEASCQLIIRSGSFGVDSNFTPADSGNDRWLIDADAFGAPMVQLEDFDVVVSGSPKNHVIRIGNMGGSGAPMLRLINCRGIESTNILLGLAGSSDKNKGPFVERLNRRQSGVMAHEYSRNFIDANRAEDRDYQDLRTDFPGKVNIFGGPLKVKTLFTPTGVSVTPTGSGATTYSYRVSALTYDGETEATAAVTAVNNATLSGSVYNTVVWTQSQGAYAYRIYGRSSGTEALMKTLTLGELADDLSYRDTGVDTPSGALPTVNTTGNATVEGVLTIGTYTSTQRDALTAANGMIIYNSTTSKFQGRAGGAWVDLH